MVRRDRAIVAPADKTPGATKVRELRKHLTDAVALRLRLNHRVNARQLYSWFSSHPAIPTRNIYWQCPWTDWAKNNLGPLLVAFVRSAAQVQKAGDALLLGLTTLSTWRESYRLETVLAAAKECGYLINAPDTAFIADALKHGYVHATEGPRRDIHHMLVHKFEVQVFIMGPPAHLARSPLSTPPPPPGTPFCAEKLPAEEEGASDGRVSPSVDALAAALAGTHVDDRNVGDVGAGTGVRTKTPAQPPSDGSAARVDVLFDHSQEAIRKLESVFRRRGDEPDGQAATVARRPSDNDQLSTTLDADHEMRAESLAPPPSEDNAAKVDNILDRSEEAPRIRTPRLEARRESAPHGRGDSEPGGQAATVACPPDGRPNGQLSMTISAGSEVRAESPTPPPSDSNAPRMETILNRSEEALRIRIARVEACRESAPRGRNDERDGQTATAARPSESRPDVQASITPGTGHEVRAESPTPPPSVSSAARTLVLLNRSVEALRIRIARLEAPRESVARGCGDELDGHVTTATDPPDSRPDDQSPTTPSAGHEVYTKSPAPPPSDGNATRIDTILNRSEEALRIRIARVETRRESVPRGRGDGPDGQAATVACHPDSRPNGLLPMTVSAGHEVRAEYPAQQPSDGNVARIDLILNRSEEALRIRVARVEGRLGSVLRRRGDEPDGQATKAARPSDSRPDDQAPTTSGVGHEAPTESPAPPQSDSNAARLDVLLNRSEEAVRTRIARLEVRRKSAPHAHDDEPEGQATTAARPPDNRPNEHVSPTLGTLLVRAEALRLQTALLAASCRFSSATDPQFSSASHASRPIFALCPPSLPSNTASPRQSTASSLSMLLASAEALRVQTALLAARHDSSPTESVRLAPVSRESVTVSASSPLASAVVAAPSAFLERFDALLTSFTRAEYSSTPTGFNTNLSGATPGFVESPSSRPETTGEQRDTAQPSDAAPPCRVQ
jgi:hypothetical protein